MTHENEIKYFKISCGMVGMTLDDNHSDLLLSMYKLVLLKREKTTIEDALEVKSLVQNRANTRQAQNTLNKHSKKVMNQQKVKKDNL